MNESLKFKDETMVVKIGSSTIAEDGNPLNRDFISDIARQVSVLRKENIMDNIVIVSSGATVCGEAMLRSASTRSFIGTVAWQKFSMHTYGYIGTGESQQVAAAFGQVQLMSEWREAFAKYGLLAAQLLYTDDQLSRRTKNAKNTQRILEVTCMEGIPIINANDSVTSAEMRKLAISADNDQLALHVGLMIRAGTLVFLTDQDGVLDDKGKVVEYVEKGEDVQEFLKKEGNGTGSMSSKVKAALSHSGFPTTFSYSRALIANGRRENILLDAAARKKGIGTWFAKKSEWLES